MIHAEVLFHIADTLEGARAPTRSRPTFPELLHKGEDAVLKKWRKKPPKC